VSSSCLCVLYKNIKREAKQQELIFLVIKNGIFVLLSETKKGINRKGREGRHCLLAYLYLSFKGWGLLFLYLMPLGAALLFPFVVFFVFVGVWVLYNNAHKEERLKIFFSRLVPVSHTLDLAMWSDHL